MSWQDACGSPSGGLLGQDNVDGCFEGKSPAPTRYEPYVGTLLFQPLPQQNQSGFKVIFPLGQAQPTIHPQLAIRKLYSLFVLILFQDPPQNATRDVLDQVFTVDEDAIIGVIEAEGAWRQGRADRGRCRDRGVTGMGSSASCADCSIPAAR